MTEEVTVLLGARAQDEARTLADEGKFSETSVKLQNAAESLRAAAKSSLRPEELEVEAQRLEYRRAEIAHGLYDVMSRKQMTFENRARKQRRYRPPKGGD